MPSNALATGNTCITPIQLHNCLATGNPGKTGKITVTHGLVWLIVINCVCVSMLDSQALQKDLQANVSALNEVISSTEKFLEENRSKLTPEQISALENKLEELKSKANMLNQKSEESRKDLEKVLSSAIQQETEKVRGEKHFPKHYSVKRLNLVTSSIACSLCWL